MMWRALCRWFGLGLAATVVGVAAAAEPLTVDDLEMALTLGRRYLLASQTPAGNFTYEYNLQTGKTGADDNGVRQAGTLWGLALVYQHRPDPEVAQAIRRGLAYFSDLTHATAAGGKFILYPGSPNGTGQVALVALTLVDFLRAKPPLTDAERQAYEDDLARYLAFLTTLQLANGQFADGYTEAGAPAQAPSPYADGETLLLFVKAAKYAGHDELKALALKAAVQMGRAYTEAAVQQRRDDEQTKAFYQWGTMAFYELYTSNWPDTDTYAQRAIDLAGWMLDVHRPAGRPRNTGYAYEGLLYAWEMARLTKQAPALDKLRPAIDAGLGQLLSWQVGHPRQIAYIKDTAKPGDRQSIGGVLNSAREPGLRIDVTQHQTHAVILALRLLYGK